MVSGILDKMRPLPALLLAVTLVTAGCTSDGGSDDDLSDPAPTRPSVAVEPGDPPAPFLAATSEVPEGYTLTQCSDLRRRDKNTGLAVRFVVPPNYSAYDRHGASCEFTAGGSGAQFYVSFEPEITLKSEKERDVDPNDGVGGDGEVGDISYDTDVPVFGDHTGERLAYFCFCDGQNLDDRIVQARGVRLTWITAHGKQARSEPAYDAVTASMALVHSRDSICTSRSRNAVFRPPIPQTESIDFYGPLCHLYLRPGRGSLHRYAEIELRPPTGLAARVQRLRHRPTVRSVRYEPGVDTLDGRTADRLTWVTLREKPGPYGAPTGAWRAVALGTPDMWVTWTARPRQWRTEADDARAFYDSVRLQR